MTKQPPIRHASRLHNEPLRDAAATGVFVVQKCPGCEYIPNYPRVACPECFRELQWFPAEGCGTVVTYSIVQRPHHERFSEYVPIVLALVALENGGELITTIVGDDRLDTTIGDQVAYAPEAGWASLPQFQRQT